MPCQPFRVRYSAARKVRKDNTLIISYRAKQTLAPYGYLLPTIALLAALMVLPMVLVIWYSLLDNVIVNPDPEFVGLENFLTVIRSEVFQISVANTLYFTIMSLTFHLVIGMLFAVLLNSTVLNPVVKSVFRVFYILPWMFTATITAIIWRLMLNPSGVVNFVLAAIGATDGSTEWLSSSQTALHTLTFINIWAGYPFYMVSLLAGMQGIPSQQYEAATIDGAGDLQKFLHITIPHLTPIIVSIAMLDFIWTLHLFPLVWMTTGGGPGHSTEMLSTSTYKLAFSTYDFSMASASAVLILLFSMAVAMVYIRHQKASE